MSVCRMADGRGKKSGRRANDRDDHQALAGSDQRAQWARANMYTPAVTMVAA